MRIEITTVGKLREALADIADDTEIWAQTCGVDGSAWNMQATLADIPTAQPRKLVVTLRHPDLCTLPEWGAAPEQPSADKDHSG